MKYMKRQKNIMKKPRKKHNVMLGNFKVEILRRFTPQNDSVCHSDRSEESN